MKAKYSKPIVRNIDNLTSAVGLCTSGFSDGGCQPGTLAGGIGGCEVGNNAFTRCVSGNSVFIASECSTGNGFV